MASHTNRNLDVWSVLGRGESRELNQCILLFFVLQELCSPKSKTQATGNARPETPAHGAGMSGSVTSAAYLAVPIARERAHPGRRGRGGPLDGHVVHDGFRPLEGQILPARADTQHTDLTVARCAALPGMLLDAPGPLEKDKDLVRASKTRRRT